MAKKIVIIDNEYDCPYYCEEDDLSMGVMLICNHPQKIETRWEKGYKNYEIPYNCPLPNEYKQKGDFKHD